MVIRPSGRSSDYISPSFGYGCLLNCSYCYMKRHLPEGLTIATNIDTILKAIDTHCNKLGDKIANQTHEKYHTYDIACNEDFALHKKYYDWKKIFEFFKNHPKAFGTFATKIVPYDFLSYDPNQKIRIRFSLMPQKISSILEPNTPDILERIQAVDKFIEAGYDVHLNYSPVVIYENWREDYKELFKLVNENIKEENKSKVLSEVIFLTHNKDKHQYNLDNNISGEDLLWLPEYQESKTSQYGGKNLRYKYKTKKKAIEVFKNIHQEVVPWNTIRYIF